MKAMTSSSRKPASSRTAADSTELSESAKRILEVALTLFEEMGYEGVSTDQLAHEANVSKATIYKMFGPKDKLLIAAIRHGCDKVRLSVDLSPLNHVPIADALNSVAQNMILSLLSEPAIRLLRLAISESRRSPLIASAFMQAGATPFRKALAECLATAMDRGELPRADPWIRADQFLSLISGGFIQLELLLRQRARIKPAERAALARHTVEFFLGQGTSSARKRAS